MLKRKMYDYLLRWKRTKRQECLLVKGARQVGKSYIVEAFGEREYESLVTINFLKNPSLRSIFDGELDADSVYKRMSLEIPNIRLIPGETLVFLDEIQRCPQARTALKFLAQDGRFDVVASGSLLGLQYDEDESFDSGYSAPVGYERQVRMFPLDFEEYLWAIGLPDAPGILRGYFERVEPVPHNTNEAMLGRLREYLAVGGMPAVVQSFVDTGNFQVAFAEQKAILDVYLDDIAHYAKPTDRVKARACFLSLPRQLAKENTKFQYSQVEKGGSARKFTSAIDWLRDADVVRYCRCASTPDFPLAAYASDDRFRVYSVDTGLLMNMYGFNAMAPVVNNTLRGPMKGGIYENLVAGMLAANGHDLVYWMSQSGKREIEFLLDGPGSVIPVEVKAGRNASASLDEMLARDDIELGYKLVSGNIGRSGKKVTLPLYMAMFINPRFAENP